MRKILAFTICFSFLIVFGLGESEGKKEDVQIYLNKVMGRISSIDTYQSTLKTMVIPSCTSLREMVVENTTPQKGLVRSNTIIVGKSGKKMKYKTSFATPGTNIKIHYNLLYDGKWLWIENYISKDSSVDMENDSVSLMKINVPEVSPDFKNEPFNAFYSVTGNGLKPYEDLPGTLREILSSYNFNRFAILENEEDVILTGDKKNDKDKLNNGDGGIDSKLSYCHLKVNRNTFLISAILYGNSEDTVCMKVEINFLDINEELPENTFIYKAPKKVVVEDITQYVLEKRIKEQSNR